MKTLHPQRKILNESSWIGPHYRVITYPRINWNFRLSFCNFFLAVTNEFLIFSFVHGCLLRQYAVSTCHTVRRTTEWKQLFVSVASYKTAKLIKTGKRIWYLGRQYGVRGVSNEKKMWILINILLLLIFGSKHFSFDFSKQFLISKFAAFDFKKNNFDFKKKNFDFKTKNFDFETKNFDFKTRNFDSKTKNFDFKTKNFDFKKENFDFKTKNFDFKNKILNPNLGPCNEPQFDNYLLRKIQNKQKWHKIGFFQFLFWI